MHITVTPYAAKPAGYAMVDAPLISSVSWDGFGGDAAAAAAGVRQALVYLAEIGGVSALIREPGLMCAGNAYGYWDEATGRRTYLPTARDHYDGADPFCTDWRTPIAGGVLPGGPVLYVRLPEGDITVYVDNDA